MLINTNQLQKKKSETYQIRIEKTTLNHRHVNLFNWTYSLIKIYESFYKTIKKKTSESYV